MAWGEKAVKRAESRRTEPATLAKHPPQELECIPLKATDVEDDYVVSVWQRKGPAVGVSRRPLKGLPDG